MSEHVPSLVAALSDALANREFDRAEGLITDLERAYDGRRASERTTVEATKRRYAESTADGPERNARFAGLLGESGTTQFTRVAALTLAASVTEAHAELAEEGLLDEYVEMTRTSLAELADAEPSFAATLDTVDEMDTSSGTDGGGTEGPFEPPGPGGDTNAETPSRNPADDEDEGPVEGPFEPPGPSSEPDSVASTATPSSGPAADDGSTDQDGPLGPPGLPGDSDLETATSTQSPSPVAGDATATTGSAPATSDDDSSESDTETTATDGPGFGFTSALASVGGVGYLFYRRLVDEPGDDE